MRITRYERSHLPGVLALCTAKGWPTGAQRIDLITDTAEDFYASLPHRTFTGFRVYP